MCSSFLGRRSRECLSRSPERVLALGLGRFSSFQEILLAHGSERRRSRKTCRGLIRLPDELLPVLRREERNRRRRWATIAIFTATLVAALTTALAVWALKETQIAEDRSRQALIRQSQALAALAELKSAQGDHTLGSLLALNALPGIDGGRDRPFTVAAEASLYRSLISAREKHVISVSPCTATAIAFSASGQRFVTGCFPGNRDAQVRVFDAASGKVVLSLPYGSARVDFVSLPPRGLFRRNRFLGWNVNDLGCGIG